MTFPRLLSFLLFTFGALTACGWFFVHGLGHALGMVAAGLALELLAGVPIVPSGR